MLGLSATFTGLPAELEGARLAGAERGRDFLLGETAFLNAFFNGRTAAAAAAVGRKGGCF